VEFQFVEDYGNFSNCKGTKEMEARNWVRMIWCLVGGENTENTLIPEQGVRSFFPETLSSRKSAGPIDGSRRAENVQRGPRFLIYRDKERYIKEEISLIAPPTCGLTAGGAEQYSLVNYRGGERAHLPGSWGIV